MFRLAGQTVYSKALAIIVALSFLLGVAVVSLSQFVIVREFRRVEVDETRGAMLRIIQLARQEVRLLSASLDEWILDGALPPETEGSISLVSPEGGVTLLSGTDPNAMARHVVGQLKPDELKAGGSGYFLVDGQAVAVTWRAEAPGFARGSVLISTRPLTPERLDRLGAFFSGRLSFLPLSSFTIGTPGTESLVNLLAGSEPVAVEEGRENVVGLTILSGFDGMVIGFLQLDRPMFLAQQGARAVQVFLTILALAGGILFLFLWVLLDRTILARIRELTRQVELEQARGRLPVELDFSGGDELGTLARRIEELAGLLDRARQEYRAVVEDQTEMICRFDSHFQITFSNEAFQRAFRSGSGTGRHRLPDLVDDHTAALLLRRFERLHPTGFLETFQHSLQLPDQGTRWVRSTLRKNFTPRGEALGGQWVACDVTPQVEAEREVQESERRLRLLSRRLLSLQDDERRRIARELHDSTAQSLSALEMNTSLLEPLATDERTAKIVRQTREIARDCCRELRNISYLLHPPLLDEVGLAFAIKWFVDGFTERTGIGVELDLQEDFPRLHEDIETALFRVVQESCTNIYKHSGASRAWISLQIGHGGGLTMAIRDNGRGLEPAGLTYPAPASLGIGLAGMRERLQEFGGKIELSSSPSGVTVSISIPRDHVIPQED